MFRQSTKQTSIILTTILLFGLAITTLAQFRIKMAKTTKPNVMKTELATQSSNKYVVNNSSSATVTRQMVMDDGYTFFDAEPVEARDQKLNLKKDIGWYLTSRLRMLGTFPKRSAFKVVVKKDGKQMAVTRCDAKVYQKANDISLKTPILKRGKDLRFEDFMYYGRFGCGDEDAVVKATGKMNVEIHYIDGDTNEEKLVRTYRIDVHRASRVRGSTTNPQPDVAHYYIQRHAESAVAFLHVNGNHTGRGDRNAGKSYFLNSPASRDGTGYGQLVAYFSYSPGDKKGKYAETFASCSVNGQRIKMQNDSVSYSSLRRREYGYYTDRIAPQYKKGSAYKDVVDFRVMRVALPLYTGKTRNTKIEDYPGKWECRIMEGGEKLRTLRWDVGSDGEIARHPEQKNGNVNLYYKTYLVDMEIPEDGADFDYRLMPMPNAGLFYGIPWTTAEGKKMAGNVPKVGNPFHIPSNKLKK